MSRVLAIVVLCCAVSADAALMTTPQPAPDWMKVRLTPVTNRRANTRLGNGGYSSDWKILHYDSVNDRTAESFWIHRPEDNVVGIIQLNVTVARFTQHDFAPEFAAAIDVLTATIGPYSNGFRQFTYSAPGYERVVWLDANGGVPEPGALALAVVALCGAIAHRRLRTPG